MTVGGVPIALSLAAIVGMSIVMRHRSQLAGANAVIGVCAVLTAMALDLTFAFLRRIHAHP